MANCARGDAAGASAAPPGRHWERTTQRSLLTAEHPQPRWPTTRLRLSRGELALAGVVLSGVALCVAASKTNTLLPQSVRPVPDWLAGPLRFFSFRLRAGELIAVIALMFASYVVTVLRVREVSAKAVIISVVALNVLALLAPPLFSTDVFSYQAYAKMFAIYGTNPYANGPYAISLDPLYYFIGAKWIQTPSVYGPLFTLLSAGLAHASISASELVFKLVATASSLVVCRLIWRMAVLRGRDPVAGLALFGLNPLVVLYGVGGGHNDLLMLALSTAGVYAVLRGRAASGGALVALSAGIKLTGAVVAPFAFAARTGVPPQRRRARFTAGLLVTASVIATAGFLWFGSGLLHMPGTLESVQNDNPWGSLPGILSSLIGGSIAHFVSIAFGLACAVLCAWLLREVWFERMDWIEGAAWLTLAMLFTASSVLPWYWAWTLPLVAVCSNRRLWHAALILSPLVGILTVAGYVPGGAFFGL